MGANKIILDALPTVSSAPGSETTVEAYSRVTLVALASNPPNRGSSFWGGCCAGLFCLPCWGMYERRRLRRAPRPEGGAWYRGACCGDCCCGCFFPCCSTHQVSKAMAINLMGQATIGGMMASVTDPGHERQEEMLEYAPEEV